MRPPPSLLLVVAFATLILLVSEANAGGCVPWVSKVELSPSDPIAPAEVSATGEYDGSMAMVIDWGDGTVEDLNAHWSKRFELPHTYGCPGTYTWRIRVSGPYGPDAESETSIEVHEMSPSPRMRAWVSDVVPQGIMYIQLEDETLFHMVTGSTVDWGDGSPAEDFTWYYQVGQWMTPFHDIDNSLSGHFTATVTHYYGFEPCVVERKVMVPWSIRVSTPVEPSTWGRIKSLYGE